MPTSHQGRGLSGAHFDPQVVEAFFRREKEFERLAAERADSDRAGWAESPDNAEQASLGLVEAGKQG